MSNGQSDQNSEVLSLLRLLLTEVKTLATDMQDLKTNQQALATNQQALATNQQALATNQQALATDVQEVKTDVREIKSWSRVTDNRLDNMENKLVDFATELTFISEKVDSLDEKVDARLHDTRPMWEALNLRLNAMEAELATIKSNQLKSDQAAQEFRQELISRFRQLEKDLSFYRKHAQIDVGDLAKDVIELELRLEKVESKLEIKN